MGISQSYFNVGNYFLYTATITFEWYFLMRTYSYRNSYSTYEWRYLLPFFPINADKSFLLPRENILISSIILSYLWNYPLIMIRNILFIVYSHVKCICWTLFGFSIYIFSCIIISHKLNYSVSSIFCGNTLTELPSQIYYICRHLWNDSVFVWHKICIAWHIKSAPYGALSAHTCVDFNTNFHLFKAAWHKIFSACIRFQLYPGDFARCKWGSSCCCQMSGH